MPAIEQLTRIEPVHLARLQAHGLFTTGLLLERTETPTRRQTLADETDASPADVAEWRDEALLLNLAFFGPMEHELLAQIGVTGVAALASATPIRRRISADDDGITGLSRTARMAMIMPMAPNRLPRREVSGLLRPPRLRMNRMLAMM